MQPQTKIEPGKHIPQLDGLRGIAILMVICYHFFPNNIICNFGWSGVDLFFVLSGFLITGRLLPYLHDRKILSKFYRNRFLRIVPLYFLFLSLFFAGWFLLVSKETLGSFTFYRDHWWQYYLFIQNWVYANNLSEIKTHLLHLWSVAIEEQIYLVFPLFLLLIRDKSKLFYAVLFTILTILISRCCYYYFVIPQEQYLLIFYNTFFRLDSFLNGVLVYFIFQYPVELKKSKMILQWLGLICFLLLLANIIITNNAEKNNAFISSVGYTFIAVMYASLLQAVLKNKNKIMVKITSTGILRYTGRISYGMYIFHWPLYLLNFTFLSKVFAYVNFSPGTNVIHWINIVISLAATYLISHLSFKYFESYFLKRKIKAA